MGALRREPTPPEHSSRDWSRPIRFWSTRTSGCTCLWRPRAFWFGSRVRSETRFGSWRIICRLRTSTIGDGPIDFKDYGPQLSRSFRALKVWMTFKAYGARRLRAAIESNIAVMRYLADRIDESPDFVRLAPVPLSVVCFQYRTSDVSRHEDQTYLDRLNNQLLEALEQDGRVFLSGTKIRGQTALRACSVNHRLRRSDVDFLLDVIREVARDAMNALRRVAVRLDTRHICRASRQASS